MTRPDAVLREGLPLGPVIRGGSIQNKFMTPNDIGFYLLFIGVALLFGLMIGSTKDV